MIVLQLTGRLDVVLDEVVGTDRPGPPVDSSRFRAGARIPWEPAHGGAIPSIPSSRFLTAGHSMAVTLNSTE